MKLSLKDAIRKYLGFLVDFRLCSLHGYGLVSFLANASKLAIHN